MTAALTIACLVCSEPFTVEHATRGRLPRFCSDDCRRKRHLAQAQQYRDEGRHPRRSIGKTCVVCSNPFETTNLRTVCCGLECGFRLLHQRSATTRTARRIERDARLCRQCGDSFVARNPSGKARRGETKEGQFCSRRCAAIAATTRPARQLSLGLPR